MSVPGPVIGYGWYWSANATFSHGQLYVAPSRADKAAQTVDETTRTESEKDSIDKPGLENSAVLCHNPAPGNKSLRKSQLTTTSLKNSAIFYRISKMSVQNKNPK